MKAGTPLCYWLSIITQEENGGTVPIYYSQSVPETIIMGITLTKCVWQSYTCLYLGCKYQTIQSGV